MKIIKYLFNFFFGKFIFSLLKNKSILFVDNRFLGSFLNFMYYKLSLNEDVIVIFEPNFFNKNKKNYLLNIYYSNMLTTILKKKN